jgi:hypothetical protein
MFLPPILAMHIPDGFLSLPIAVIGWVLLIVLIALALRQSRELVRTRSAAPDSTDGILAAFIFAAQMSTSRWRAARPATCWAPRLPQSYSAPGPPPW